MFVKEGRRDGKTGSHEKELAPVCAQHWEEPAVLCSIFTNMAPASGTLLGEELKQHRASLPRAKTVERAYVKKQRWTADDLLSRPFEKIALTGMMWMRTAVSHLHGVRVWGVWCGPSLQSQKTKQIGTQASDSWIPGGADPRHPRAGPPEAMKQFSLHQGI